MKKILAAAGLLLLAGSLWSQSVADLARQEKARREAVKGRTAKVVTNADLARVKKRPAILVAPAEPLPEESAASAAAPSPAAGDASSSDDTVMVPTVIPSGPAFAGPAAPVVPATAKDLEARLKAAEDLVSRLTDEMNQLVTQSSNINGLNPREKVQQQIEETSKKLAEAKDEVEILKAKLETAGKSRPAGR